MDDIANLSPAILQTVSLNEIIHILGNNNSGPTGRPVSLFSLILNGYIFGFSPFAFKAVNLIIHILNGLLIGSLTAKLLESADRDEERSILAISCLTATLWLVHPMQLSTVLYPVQRMAQLACFFSLASLIIYLDIRRRLLVNRPLPVLGTVALAMGIMMAVLSKENGALLPLFILLVEIYFLKLKTASIQQHYYLIFLLGLFCVLPIILGVYYLVTHTHSIFPNRDFNLYERLLTEANVLVFYLQNIIIPNLSNMSLFLDGFPVARHFDQQTLINVFVLIAMLASAVFTFKKAPILSFGIFFYFSGHSMESTVIPLELAFEHRNYLPLFGLMLPTAYYLINSRVLVSSKLKMIAIFLIILVLSLTTWLRSNQWSDAMQFYASSVINQPLSMRASVGMANVLLANNQLQQARFFLERAEQLSPKTAAPVIHRLVTYCATYEHDPISALLGKASSRIEHGIIDGYTVDIINRLQLLKKNKRCPAVTNAQLILLTATLFKNKRLHDPQGKYSLMHARSFNLAGNHAKAVPYFRQAIAKLPKQDVTEVLLELAATYIELNDRKSASEIAEQLKQRHNPPFDDTYRHSRQVQWLISENENNVNANTIDHYKNNDEIQNLDYTAGQK